MTTRRRRFTAEFKKEVALFSKMGWRAEPFGSAGDGGSAGEAERRAAMRPAEAEPVVAVLRAEGRERGEPGADASDRRVVHGLSVLRQPADGAAPVAGRACDGRRGGCRTRWTRRPAWRR